MPPDNRPDRRGNRLLAALPEADRRRIQSHLEPVEMTIKMPVYRAGEPIDHVYFPDTCVLSVLAMMDDGQAVEVATSATRARMAAGTFREVANGAGALQELMQRYTYAFFTQLSQGSACNRLHASTSAAPAGCC